MEFSQSVINFLIVNYDYYRMDEEISFGDTTMSDVVEEKS